MSVLSAKSQVGGAGALAWLTRLSWLALGYNVLVILWGAYVRISGAGAGCGDHWPLCDGQIVPRSFTLERVIEYSHRLTSGLSGMLAIGLVVMAFLVTRKGHPARLGAGLTLGLIVLEGLVGGVQVLLGLTATSTNPARGFVQGVHLANTFALLAAMLLTAFWAGGAPAPRWPAPAGRDAWLRWAVPLITVAMLLLGMAGAVTALGDKLFMPAPGTPLNTVQHDFGATTSIIQQLRVVHPMLAIVVCALLLWFIDKVRRGRDLFTPAFARSTGWLYTVMGLQIAAGILNVALKAPGWLQLVHLTLACVMWLVVVALMYSALSAAEQSAPAPLATVGA